MPRSAAFDYSLTNDDIDRCKSRLANYNDGELGRFLDLAIYMTSPLANFGKQPRQAFIVRRNLAEEELSRRKGSQPSDNTLDGDLVRNRLHRRRQREHLALVEAAGL
jgi:hypothetical protein